MNLSLQHKNALVCGSTQGIGKAAAIELALLGANVTLLARNEESLKASVRDLDTTLGQEHTYLIADFADTNALKALAENSIAKGNYHILVNNTGGPPAGPAKDAKVEDFLSAFKNHLVANHIITQAVIESMKAAGYGRIINVISTSVKQPIPGLGVSNTIRAAVGNWAKTLAGELGQFGITVNNVLPGATATQRLHSIITNNAAKKQQSEDEVSAHMVAEIPMKRFAQPEEIAAAVAFLASPAAGYINGINVPVDGGRTACL
jgi:3-oxoacyl-[acyl-carrier protein] reductase